MMSTMDSILSTGERDVARRLGEGETIGEIADARDTSKEAVERARERIREKTDRALETLLESPFTGDRVAQLDSDRRAELQAHLNQR